MFSKIRGPKSFIAPKAGKLVNDNPQPQVGAGVSPRRKLGVRALRDRTGEGLVAACRGHRVGGGDCPGHRSGQRGESYTDMSKTSKDRLRDSAL